MSNLRRINTTQIRLGLIYLIVSFSSDIIECSSRRLNRILSNVDVSLRCLPSFRDYVDMIKSKFPTIEPGLQYEIAELLKSAETRSENEKNIMAMEMKIEKNITKNYYSKMVSHLTQR